MKDKRLHPLKVNMLLIGTLALGVLLSLCFGSAGMSLSELWGALTLSEGYERLSAIVYTLRLPRSLGGALSGSALALSGLILQKVTDNSLASPNIIGVNSGAGFAVVLSMLVAPSLYYLRPLAAFVGALCTALVITAVADKTGRSKASVILSGVAVTALLNGAISFLSYLDSDLLSSYNYFSVGSLSGVSLKDMAVPFAVTALSFALTAVLSSKIDILCLGDSIALSLGVNVRALRFTCLILASASAASAVSFAGLLGFVGLVVPNISRRLTDGRTGSQVIFCGIGGGALVVLADFLGRILLSPTEIPVGVVMAFIGAPFLFYILIRRRSYAEV